VQKEFVIQNFKRFRPYFVANAPLERLHTGVMWGEGPVYFADLGILLFSDVPGEKIYRYVDGQAPTVFRQPSGNANADTRDRDPEGAVEAMQAHIKTGWDEFCTNYRATDVRRRVARWPSREGGGVSGAFVRPAAA